MQPHTELPEGCVVATAKDPICVKNSISAASKTSHSRPYSLEMLSFGLLSEVNRRHWQYRFRCDFSRSQFISKAPAMAIATRTEHSARFPCWHTGQIYQSLPHLLSPHSLTSIKLSVYPAGILLRSWRVHHMEAPLCFHTSRQQDARAR